MNISTGRNISKQYNSNRSTLILKHSPHSKSKYQPPHSAIKSHRQKSNGDTIPLKQLSLTPIGLAAFIAVDLPVAPMGRCIFMIVNRRSHLWLSVILLISKRLKVFINLNYLPLNNILSLKSPLLLDAVPTLKNTLASI